MTTVRALESPLRAWRSFRDIARATRTLAAAQALHWAEHARHADRHSSWCETVAEAHPLPLPGPGPRARVVVLLGSDLGLCGPLNQRVADRARQAGLDDTPTVLRMVVGTRLAALASMTGAIELPAPSSLPAARRLAAQIEDRIVALPSPLDLDLSIVLASSIEGDGSPRVSLRTRARPGLEPSLADQRWFAQTRGLLDDALEFARATHLLSRHARIVAALCRACTSEHEARLRTMSRAYEASQRRIAEQERHVRKLRQELITQEMLEARVGLHRAK